MAKRVTTHLSTSTTEAEYQLALSAVKEALRLKNLISDFTSGRLSKQIVTYSENQACINIMDNNHNMQKTKLIEVAHHFVRGRVMFGNIAKVRRCWLTTWLKIQISKQFENALQGLM